MKFRTGIIAVALMAVTIFSLFYTKQVVEREPGGERAPNILIISMCSFRYKLLSAYTESKEIVMPAFERFFKTSSFVFGNAFNGTPWTAFFDVAEILLPLAQIQQSGYVVRSNSYSAYILRIPHRESWAHPDNAPIDDSDFEKNHQAETNYLKSIVKRQQPFFIVAHYKYMHFPLIDRFNADSDWDYYLNGEERRRISEYLEHPEKYPEKLPFLLMLGDDARVPLSHPRVKKVGNLQDPWQQIKVKGLLTDPGMLDDWKKSAGYQDDLALLEKVYKGNARYLDKVIGPALDLWGDPYLKRNTIVILTGDHGEMHMEHGVLTHGYSLFDDSLKVAMAVRFPGHEQPVRIDNQMQFRMLANLVQGMVRGTVNADNFEKTLAKVNEDTFLLRNCTNSKRGLRYKNEYKYIYDVGEDKPYLYDLKADPGESKDISLERPDLVDRFEKEYWQLFPKYSVVDPGGCASWNRNRAGGE